MAFLSWFAKPVSILVWNSPDIPRNGMKHIITNVNFQLNVKAMMKEATMLVSELTIVPIWGPVACKKIKKLKLQWHAKFKLPCQNYAHMWNIQASKLQLTSRIMDASVASLVVKVPGLFLGSSNQPISCFNMAWKPTFLSRRVSSSPDLAKAYPCNIITGSVYMWISASSCK